MCVSFQVAPKWLRITKPVVTAVLVGAGKLGISVNVL